jgi:hypothetical protein
MSQRWACDRFHGPIHRHIQPIRHFIGPRDELSADTQYSLFLRSGKGGDVSKNLPLRQFVQTRKDLLHQGIVVRRCLVSLKTPYLPDSTSVDGTCCHYQLHSAKFNSLAISILLKSVAAIKAVSVIALPFPLIESCSWIHCQTLSYAMDGLWL